MSTGLGFWVTAQPATETAVLLPPSMEVIAKPTIALQITMDQAVSDRLWLAPARIEGQTQGSGAIVHQWPGFYAEARFRGNAIVARFADEINRLRIAVDGGAAAIVEISRIGRQDVDLRSKRG